MAASKGSYPVLPLQLRVELFLSLEHTSVSGRETAHKRHHLHGCPSTSETDGGCLGLGVHSCRGGVRLTVYSTLHYLNQYPIQEPRVNVLSTFSSTVCSFSFSMHHCCPSFVKDVLGHLVRLSEADRPFGIQAEVLRAVANMVVLLDEQFLVHSAVHKAILRLLRGCVGDQIEEQVDGRAKPMGAASNAARSTPSEYEEDREYWASAGVCE